MSQSELPRCAPAPRLPDNGNVRYTADRRRLPCTRCDSHASAHVGSVWPASIRVPGSTMGLRLTLTGQALEMPPGYPARYSSILNIYQFLGHQYTEVWF